MPEGPEIRRAADKLAAAVIDQPLTAVDFTFPQLKHYRQRLLGERIVAIEPRGKALLTHFSNGLTMYSHNQLYGVWKVAAAGETPAAGWHAARPGVSCRIGQLSARRNPVAGRVGAAA